MIVWLAISTALALALGFGLASRGAHAAGLLAGAFVLAGTAGLWLINPLWFPAMRFANLGAVDLVMLTLIAGQGALALAIALHAGGGPGGIFGAIARLGVFRLVTFFGLIVLFAVSIQGYWGRFGTYGAHLVVEGAIAAMALVTLGTLVAVTPGRVQVPRIPPICLAALTAGASLVLGLFAFEGLPHVEDELAYILQARGFAQGAASFEAPPEAARAALDYYLLEVSDGRWFVTTPPGWTLVLALGEVTGLSLLINPLLSALSVLLLHGLLRRTGDADTAYWATLFFATSPWLIAMGGSLMNHSLSLMLALLAWWLVSLPAATRGRAMAYALGAGLALGWLFATRQLEGVLVGVATGLWFFRTGIMAGMTRAIPFGIGCVVTGSLYLIHNAVLTGSILVAPLATYTSNLWGEGANGFGFGPQIGPPAGDWGQLDLFPGHSPLEAVIHTANNIASLDFEMFGWPIGALALVWCLFLWGRMTRLEKAAAGFVAVLIAVHAGYWFAASFYIGPRYWYLAFPALALLSAAGLRGLLDRLGPNHDAGLRLAAVTLSLFSLIVFTSWIGVARYHELRGRTMDLHNQIAQMDLGNALVFVKTSGDISTAFMHNDMRLPVDHPIFLRDRGAEANAAVAAAFPGRPVITLETR